jgi:hypothetical protein
MKIQEMRQEFCVWTATSHHVAVMTQAAELKNIDEKLKYASASKNACYLEYLVYGRTQVLHRSVKKSPIGRI